jgi:hypothetical protein
MAPILSHGQTTSGQCGFNQAASHPADPMKRHRARRERSHPKAMLNTQTSAVALDLLENSIGQQALLLGNALDLWFVTFRRHLGGGRSGRDLSPRCRTRCNVPLLGCGGLKFSGLRDGRG